MSPFLKFLNRSNTGRLGAIWNNFWWTKIPVYKVLRKSTKKSAFFCPFLPFFAPRKKPVIVDLQAFTSFCFSSQRRERD